LVRRAIKAGKLTPDGSSPSQWIEWAISKGWKIPLELQGGFQESSENKPQNEGGAQTDANQINSKAKTKIEETNTSTRRDKQINLICTVARELKYQNLQAIPEGGKAAIKSKCLENTALFTCAGFDHAWKEANRRKLISMKDKEKYL
jgi:hypothetical protein